jgi:hypothetical protein
VLIGSFQERDIPALGSENMQNLLGPFDHGIARRELDASEFFAQQV